MNHRHHPELPTATWRDAGGPPFRLTPAHAGVLLGTNRAGRAVTLPAGPAPTRIAVLGESLFGRLFGLRMLAVGARVTAATRVPDEWQGIARVAGDRLTVADSAAGWPTRPPAPPTGEGGPQALVCDLRRPPPAILASGAWRTVLHVTRDAPSRSFFWSAPDALLALDARFADAAGRVLGTEAARLTAALTPGEIILFRPSGTEILRPDISPAETALLTPGLAVTR
ncbi:hypothetical protein [Streptomyces litchfieldiae]|uniref:Uncharacterized protein n=1 Tax=Streptomyces litchfieldiae TaxID=3075543 RepID=A0ABU2N1B1_9ACTN|nr:hypothetical protein [Streptomyces sp. DSM 44938]MDT0347690.1 hypothetical protein [Streptomyces sp. DSM 44938]